MWHFTANKENDTKRYKSNIFVAQVSSCCLESEIEKLTLIILYLLTTSTGSFLMSVTQNVAEKSLNLRFLRLILVLY